ncbi:hypothetical protein D3C87_1783140 [compost metagenome]
MLGNEVCWCLDTCADVGLCSRRRILEVLLTCFLQSKLFLVLGDVALGYGVVGVLCERFFPPSEL